MPLPNSNGLDPDFQSRLEQMVAASGGRMWINSGYRSVERQQQLWEQALAKYGDPEIADNWVARPGSSNHNHGAAADLGFADDSARRWAHENAARFGLVFPMDHEPWHIEPVGGRKGGWTKGGGHDEQHIAEEMANTPTDSVGERLHAILRIIGQSPGDVPADQASMETPGESMVGVATMEKPAWSGGKAKKAWGTGGGKAGGVKAAGDFQEYARRVMQERYGWDDEQFAALQQLWQRESGWNPNADNPTSTAYGIAQFLNGTWAGTGIQRTSDPYKQIDAGLIYIANRYGNPQAAWNFWNRNNPHWY